MKTLQETLASLSFAQIGWVIPDIEATMKFLETSLAISFPPPAKIDAVGLNMTYFDKIEEAEWLTTQAYSGGLFIELVQPLSGKSMFTDFLSTHPTGACTTSRV